MTNSAYRLAMVEQEELKKVYAGLGVERIRSPLNRATVTGHRLRAIGPGAALKPGDRQLSIHRGQLRLGGKG
ncbi:MAG TPA: hypothetical protein VLZ81_11555 [Blastocatellia bacterium]|nr:hypothetical protein [Blastocatellia bacterium]